LRLAALRLCVKIALETYWQYALMAAAVRGNQNESFCFPLQLVENAHSCVAVDGKQALANSLACFPGLFGLG
jgi:hypothetical protein